ncbi:MAG TPA: nuclear transport factor 2 family protein [Steroidobacteraceae bacterium]|nr:nuclear transport factor 2 family protein [Steroidobacteraceae bacterium]
MLTELHELNSRWFQAWLEKDAATVERLMAQDYVYIAPSGRVLDRQAILAIIRAPSYRLDRFARTDIEVRAVGDAAVVMRDRRQSAGSFDGAAFSEEHRGVMVWAKHAGEWRLVMEQCSFDSK